MKYYFLIFFLAIAGFVTFVQLQKDPSREIIKSSKLVENPNLTIGDLFNKNFGNQSWNSTTNSLGQPAVLFTGIVLKQDSLRLNGAQINFLFTVNKDSAVFRTDSVWWSYPDSYLDKRRAELGCFEEEKLLRTLKYIYAVPQNLLVSNGQKWFSCKSSGIAPVLSVVDLRLITEQLLSACPLSILEQQFWQINAAAGDWESIGWPAGVKTFAFTQQVQQEIKNLLRHNFNQSSKMAYLNGNHGLEQQDSLKIFF